MEEDEGEGQPDNAEIHYFACTAMKVITPTITKMSDMPIVTSHTLR